MALWRRGRGLVLGSMEGESVSLAAPVAAPLSAEALVSGDPSVAVSAV